LVISPLLGVVFQDFHYPLISRTSKSQSGAHDLTAGGHHKNSEAPWALLHTTPSPISQVNYALSGYHGEDERKLMLSPPLLIPASVRLATDANTT
jgi:hypothetical protein